MSAPCDPPLDSLFAGLSADQVIAEEEEHQETQLPAQSTLRKHASPSHDTEGGDEDDSSPPTPGEENSSSHPGSTTHSNPTSLRTEQVVRRMAKRLKLSNDSISLVEQFSQEHSLDVRLLLLFGNTVAVGNELAELRQSIGGTSYQIGEELEENIKKYSRLAFLSPSIHHYKGKIPREHLIKIIVKYRFGIPPNIEANGYAWAKITACIDHELTQARGRMKKILKSDASKPNPQSRMTIYRLTQVIVGEESYTISPATCTRVAIMRQIYFKFPGPPFWDEVDKVLDSIKSMGEGKQFSYLKAILSRDRRLYGVEPGTTADLPSVDTTLGNESLIQQRIEDLIQTPGGSTAFQSPHDVLDT